MIKEDLKSGKTLYGLSNSYPGLGIIKCMGYGWDIIWIDGQHGIHDQHSIYNAIQEVEAVKAYSLIRIPCLDKFFIGYYADMLPSIIMVPMINNAI